MAQEDWLQATLAQLCHRKSQGAANPGSNTLAAKGAKARQECVYWDITSMGEAGDADSTILFP